MKKETTPLQILILQYEREISKAHTIFSSFWEIFNGIVIGTIGIWLSLIQVGAFNFNKLYFILTLAIVLTLIAFIAIGAWYQRDKSRIRRERLEQEIRTLLQRTHPNQP
ncbi:MAG TPA: hypothetical protein VJB08_05970 [Candidatus Nanoarchaeia archaeon]|nr:hypothetical protein [Candidatus Nanoarchaeia archaeon]HLD43498.1 hypothetical protein [Candidatus Nanoarchaeia archaeon]